MQEFLRFFASKRELYMAEVEGVFQDVRDARYVVVAAANARSASAVALA